MHKEHSTTKLNKIKKQIVLSILVILSHLNLNPIIFHKSIYGLSLSSIPFSLSNIFAWWTHQLLLSKHSSHPQRCHGVSLDRLALTDPIILCKNSFAGLLNIALVFPPKSYIMGERRFFLHFYAISWESYLLFPTKFFLLRKLLTSSLLISHLVHRRWPIVTAGPGLRSLQGLLVVKPHQLVILFLTHSYCFSVTFLLIPKNIRYPWPIKHLKLAVYGYLNSQ